MDARRTSPLRLCLALATAALGAAATTVALEPVEADFERLSIEQGLSQSIVERIVQDRRGFMWFVTEDGLNRYDGYRFVVFRHRADHPASLSHNELKALTEDRDGVLWVGAFAGGLNRFDPASEAVTRYLHDPADPASLAAETVRAVLAARDGSLWVGTQGGGLDRLDRASGSFEHHRHDPADPATLPHDDVRALLEDSAGALWVGTFGGLARGDRDGAAFTRLTHAPGDPTSLVDDQVMTLLEDRRGRLWVGTRGGLDLVDRATLVVRHVLLPEGAETVTALVEDHLGAIWVASDGHGVGRLDPDDPDGTSGHWFRHDPIDPHSLSSDRVWSLYQDRFHVLWVGTYGGGVNRFDAARKPFRQVRHDPTDPASLSHDIVWSFAEAADGTLWVGTDSGGLNRRDPATGAFRHYRHDPADPSSLPADTVRALCLDRAGRLWVATHGGGLARLDPGSERFVRYRHDPADPSSLAWDELRSVMEDRAGRLWVGTFGGGLDRLDPATGAFAHHRHEPANPATLASDFIRLTFEDAAGVLWVGTQGGGLAQSDGRGGFTTYRHDPADPASLSNDHVFALVEGRDGRFWAGTFGGGLNLVDRASGRCRAVRAEDGLASDGVYAVLEDQAGQLWVSTTRGLSRFDPASGAVRTYDSADGLQANEFNGGAAFRSPRGELYFGGIGGYNVFRPDHIVANPTAPEVVITDLLLFNRPVPHGVAWDDGRVLLTRPTPFTDEVTLSHRDAVVSIEFSGLHYSAPSKNRYRYTLSGFHEGWIPAPADRRVATFTNLAPGRYLFQVQASNADGVWSERGASLGLVITPPFWATWWFRTLLVAALGAAVAVLARSRTRAVRMKAELQAAHDAQMAIMPQTELAVPGFEISGRCRPASEVGGDFFDAFWREGSPPRLVIAVGDAAGKAMAAAMTAVMSDGMVVARARQPGSVEDIMASVNRALHAKVPTRMFTALCLLELDPATHHLELGNGGLCDPLLCGAGGVTALVAPGARYPLGRVPAPGYPRRGRTHAPGEAVVLFTDGVPEARDRAGAFYGYDAPAALLAGLDPSVLSAAAIRDALLADVHRFTASAPQSDDLTVVVLRCRAEAGG